jgi:hypothetical protein
MRQSVACKKGYRDEAFERSFRKLQNNMEQEEARKHLGQEDTALKTGLLQAERTVCASAMESHLDIFPLHWRTFHYTRLPMWKRNTPST